MSWGWHTRQTAEFHRVWGGLRGTKSHWGWYMYRYECGCMRVCTVHKLNYSLTCESQRETLTKEIMCAYVYFIHISDIDSELLCNNPHSTALKSSWILYHRGRIQAAYITNSYTAFGRQILLTSECRLIHKLTLETCEKLYHSRQLHQG